MERHPRRPVAGRPDPGMAIRVHSASRWMDASGVIRPLRLMGTEHLVAVAGYLRWWAPDLRAMDPLAGEGSNPDYLRSLPVWQGIEAELRKRGFLSRDLYDALSSQGPVPWERLA